MLLRAFVFMTVVLLAVTLSLAEGAVILYENYDSGTPGSPVPEWVGGAGVFFTTDVAYQGAGAARVNGDYPAFRPFSLTSGIVEVDLMMRPNPGSNTNNHLFVQVANGFLGKSEDENYWFHFRGDTRIENDRPDVQDWYRILLRFNTASNTFDYYLGRAGEFLVQLEDEAPLPSWLDLSGGLSQIGLHSGRGGAGTDSYFDELRISTIAAGPGGSIPNLPQTFVPGPGHPVPEPGTLLLLGSGLAGLAGGAWRRRHRRAA
jgi:hypothetical protein